MADGAEYQLEALQLKRDFVHADGEISSVERGYIYQANLNPIISLEQAGTRSVLVVSRDGINQNSLVVIVPLTKYTPSKKIHPSHHVVRAMKNGLTADNVIRCEQTRAIAESGLQTKRDSLSVSDIKAVDKALKITLDIY